MYYIGKQKERNANMNKVIMTKFYGVSCHRLCHCLCHHSEGDNDDDKQSWVTAGLNQIKSIMIN